jgi:hypothetical protein
MKRIVLLVALAMAASAWAQAPAEKKAVRETTKAAKPKAVKHATGKKPRRWHEDARHCLDRPNNTEIIKCAEVYL